MGTTTHPADEALRMPLGVECRDIIFHDGRVAATTLGRKHIEVILAAVRLPIPFVEALVPKRVAALCAEEVLRMPGLVQGSHTFLAERERGKRRYGLHRLERERTGS